MEPGKKTNGALVGLIVVIIILVIGGLYMWMSNKNSVPAAPGAVTKQDSSDLNTLDATLQTTDTSTGVDASTVN